MSSSSSVQQLLQAEKEAAALIEAARQQRSKKIRSAQQDAQTEIRAFAQRYEEMTKQLQIAGEDNSLKVQIEREADSEIEHLKAATQKNKAQLVDLLVGACLGAK